MSPSLPPSTSASKTRNSYIPDLFTIAMGGGTIRRFGTMAILTLPGVALVTSRDEMQQLQRWGRARNSSGNEQQDRDELLKQLHTLIARADGSAATRGAPDALSRLARQMQDSGMDIAAWLIPKSVRDHLPPPRLQESPPPLPVALAVGV